MPRLIIQEERLPIGKLRLPVGKQLVPIGKLRLPSGKQLVPIGKLRLPGVPFGKGRRMMWPTISQEEDVHISIRVAGLLLNIITPWYIVITRNDEVYICGSSPMLWSEIPARQAALATPPKDQLFMKLDTDGRIKGLWVIPKGENGKEKPGELNWVHSMDIAADGMIYFGDVQGKRAQKFVPVGLHSSN